MDLPIEPPSEFLDRFEGIRIAGAEPWSWRGTRMLEAMILTTTALACVLMTVRLDLALFPAFVLIPLLIERFEPSHRVVIEREGLRVDDAFTIPWSAITNVRLTAGAITRKRNPQPAYLVVDHSAVRAVKAGNLRGPMTHHTRRFYVALLELSERPAPSAPD